MILTPRTTTATWQVPTTSLSPAAGHWQATTYVPLAVFGKPFVGEVGDFKPFIAQKAGDAIERIIEIDPPDQSMKITELMIQAAALPCISSFVA
jgi:hypothetical protein